MLSPSPFRVALVAALAIGCHDAFAQTTVSPELTVQRIAPQRVAFAGSQSNLQSLVTGLAQGTPVQLVSVLPDGSAQIVRFTPVVTLRSPTLSTAPTTAAGTGSIPPTPERATPIGPASTPTLRH